ncbi:hypothetical protein EV561_103517 [Rhizobium sp. BK376]|jgi:hypothetical protein|nr:hypothetical protein EV561_103517 [Rhizobium sp. BK376]
MLPLLWPVCPGRIFGCRTETASVMIDVLSMKNEIEGPAGHVWQQYPLTEEAYES